MTHAEDATRDSYNRVAAEYARRLSNELDHKPLERALLDAFMVNASGQICDLGCGPGQIAAYLHGIGRNVIGVDLADEMLAEARLLHPDIPFVQADMRSLPFADESLAGIVAFYSLIHIPRAQIPAVLLELWRVLQPGGEMLVGFHRGQETRHLDDFFDAAVDLDFHFFTSQEMTDWCIAAGFTILDVTERDPYPEVEVQTERAYIRASK